MGLGEPRSPANKNVPGSLRQREVYGYSGWQTPKLTADLAIKLSVETTLRGHQGCVNRLAWNAKGSLLASTSDDKKVLLWQYPETDRAPLAVETHHQANVFGVRLLPETADRQIVTGAMDHTVQLHRLDAAPAAVPVPRRSQSPAPLRRHPDAGVISVDAHTTLYACHRSRVKGVETEPSNPFLFWSASEDGTVRQFDTRCSTQQQREYDSANCLLALRHKQQMVEVKGVAINAVRPEQLAVAAGDQYVRLYDRRMMTPGTPSSEASAAQPMLQLAPVHMCFVGSTRGRSRSHSTYVAFSRRGDKVLATYHGDHAYAFDITVAQGSSSRFVAPSPSLLAESIPPSNTGSARQQAKRKAPDELSSEAYALPPDAEALKDSGNRALFEKDTCRAIRHYTAALCVAPQSAVLHANRAAAYLARGWEGDAMEALQDCEAAIEAEPGYLKAHLRRVQALHLLRQLRAAGDAAVQFRERFPPRDARSAQEIESLQSSIAAALAARERHRQQRLERLEQRRRARQRALARRMSAPQARAGAAARFLATPRPTSQPGGAPTAPLTPAPTAEPGALGPPADASQQPPATPEPRSAAGSAAASRQAGAAQPQSEPEAAESAWVSDGEDSDAGIELDPSDLDELEPPEEGPQEGWACDEVDRYGGAASGASDAGSRPSSSSGSLASQLPGPWHACASRRRLAQRYVGHCNVQTDIKECTFMGPHDELVVAGSDDGHVFIYDAHSGDIIQMLDADEDVANCCQAHPSLPLLATSGIESVVRLWSPTGAAARDDGVIGAAVRRNQERMREGPQLLRRITPRVLHALTDNPHLLSLLLARVQRGGLAEGDEEAEGEAGAPPEGSCRVA